jgi:hypothetical protein
MATTVRLLTNNQFSGVNYFAGDLVSLPDAAATALVTAKLADTNANAIARAVTEGEILKDPNITTYNKYLVKNLYPGSSEVFLVGNANTTPAATTNITLPGSPPAGLQTGGQVGATSGQTQQNITIPADNSWYIYSFYAVKATPATTGAQVIVGTTTGVFSISTAQMIYDWDAPLTASTGVFTTTTSGTLGALWNVQDVGGGYKRFSFAYKNNGTGTIFIISFTSGVASNKSIISGHMLERVPDDGTSLLPSAYIPTNVIAPFYLQGKSGMRILRDKKFTFNQVAVVSDSIWGAGTNAKLAGLIQNAFIYSSTISHSAATTAVVLADKATNAGGINWSRALVIYNVGRNDDISSQAKRDAITAALKADITSLGHNNYLVCGVLPKYASTFSGLPGTEETPYTNATNYQNIRALNDTWAAIFQNKFVDLHRISVNSYDPLSTADVAAFALDMRPPSLTGAASADNLHPGDTETQVMAAGVIDYIYSNYLFL